MKYAILLLAIPLAACDPLNALTGEPTEFQQHMERVALVTIPEPEISPEPEPVSVKAATVEIVPEPAPECTTDVFRISRCVDGKLEDW